MKRPLIFFLLFLSLLTFSTPTKAQNFEVDGIYYNRISGTDKQVEVTSGSADYSGAVVIPATVTYSGTTYSVTSIGVQAFYNCSGLTSVTIGEGVTSIEMYAFSDCSGLESVTIGENVTSIGVYAFEGCSNLTSVTIPNSVTSIGSSAFLNCSGLTLATIGEGVTSIGNYAFANCSGLTEVTIGESVTSIGDYAFKNCSDLTSVTIPNSVTSIGVQAFSSCGSLISVTIGEGVTSIEDFAFYDCSGLTSVEWNAVACQDFYDVSDGDDVPFAPFEDCENITSITFGNQVERIPARLCSGLSKLTSVTIPDSVTSIGEMAFDGCSGLTSVEWNAINCMNFTSGNRPFYDCEKITAITFGDKVEHIPAYLCYDCSDLASVTIPNGVTSIGERAFYDCNGLTSVTIPNSVTSIGNRTFYSTGLTSVEWNAINCEDFIQYSTIFSSNLTAITFGDKVAHIPAFLCSGCSGLTSVTIPENVTSIGDAAFYNCSGLTSVEWNAINCEDCAYYSTTFPSNLTTITFGDKVAHIPAYLCSGCSGLTSVTIPENVTSIGKGALGGIGLRSVEWNAINCKDFTQSSIAFPNFLTSITFGDKVEHIPAYLCYEWSGLTSVAIPNSVTSIGAFAFSGSGLTSVTIPENVTSVKKCAFSGCTGLRSVEWNAINCQDVDRASDRPFYECAKITAITFGNQVSHIPAFLCYEWSGLKSVTIPNSVTTIGFSAFSGCSGLTSVMIPNGVTTIDYGTFGRCSGLTSVTIPEGVTSIEDAAFYGCSGLTSVTIPENVTTIEDAAFYGCSSLTSVTIPASVTAIGDGAFCDCTDLTSVTSLSTTPPACPNNNVFSPHDTLYVPCGCKTAYEGAVGWYVFNKIIEQACNYITVTLLADDKMGTVTGGGEYAYGTEAAIEAVPNPGYRFVSWSDGETANPRTLTVTRDTTFTAEFASETPTPTTTKTDTLYFEFALEEGETSAIIEYRFLNTVLSGIEIEYNDGQAHPKFSPDAEGEITVNGNGHGRIYYTYEESAGYSVLCSSQDGGLNNDIRIHTLSGVNLTALDVSGCTALEALWCNHNHLTSLDVSSNTALTSFACYNNKLTGLNVNGCTALTYLDCNYNKLTSLDVSGCTALTTLWCENNQLTALDVSANSALKQLYCYTNHLTVLDVSSCTALTILDCGYNQLTTLDISKNTGLQELACADNQLTVLDIGTNTFLDYLNCEDNHLPLSILYGTYTQMGNGSSFYANNQTDTISVAMCRALDLSSESPLGGVETAYELKDEEGNAVSADAYTKNGFVFQFHNPATYTLTLQNQDLVNKNYGNLGNPIKFTYHITVAECFTVEVTSGNEAWGWATKTGNGTYEKDSSVTIIATPREGYRFVNWTREGEVFSINAVYTFAVTEDLTLVANFEEIPEEPVVEETFTLYVLANDAAWGSVSQSGNGTYKKDSLATITATAAEGYRFVNWTQADGAVFGTKADTTFKVVENLILVARFEKLPDEPEPPVEEDFTVTLTPNNPAWGLVFKTGNCTYGEGEEITIFALPFAGYRFVNWTKEDGSVFGTDSLITFKVTESLELTANFEEIPVVPVADSFSVQVFSNNEAWGRVSQSGEGRYEKDSSVTITATPNEGYRFVNWSKDGAVFGTASDTTFAVTEDLELTANFEKIPDEKPIEDDFHIYVKDNVIYLSENRGKVQVFNVIGQCLYTGNTTAIRVRQTGVYIIAVGGQNYKVLVM